ncbi:mannosyl-oligosaccharide alpha-1,2-mannosidase IA isoform X1 [Zeugodacus cucurbitae]|uniref:mannosyl-oligosaccharide alpha-1,2-mannosidase IA isoform X1 n=1 Tax=Zeugodacus cucurbitae TaxID=28588 RepID=UPI00059697FB|nr:mannosyl-oligosaccharide alpha-1,2-mannosidase IA isoform X1 [Zeugodacus cucurbitae]
MCTKTSKTPLLLIGGVCFVIVLVGITGVTLINNLNLSNIIKLNEKVASDSMSSHDAELRGDDNYANNHPKNIYKFDEFAAPYALAVGTHPHTLPAAAAQPAVLVTAAAVYKTEHDGRAASVVEADGALIGRPTAALVDAAANNGNAAAAAPTHAIMQSTAPQQALEPTLNALQRHKKLQSTATTTNENANASGALVNNPQVNTATPTNASISGAATASQPSPSDRGSLNATASINSSAYSASLPSTTTAETPSATTAVASSVSVDIAAKLMLPLILNGSARITPGFSDGNRQMNAYEKKGLTIDTIVGFKSDNATRDTQQMKNVVASSGPFVVPTGGSGADKEKRDFVVKMMQHAWDNYKLYAWGKNELRPLSQRPHSGSIFGISDLGATIVDGLDTLYIMGLEKEYQEGRDWIERKFSLDNVSADLSVFETNIRFVGGMLTLYAFTGDNMYKEKAQHIADKLLPAFQTPTGIPYALVNSRTGASRNYGWASGGSSILSEAGTLHCEFAYLSDITGNPLYRERVQTIRQVLKEIEKPKGLYPNFINPKTGKWGQMHMSLGALGDSYYEYLLKAWLQSGQVDEEAREMFDEAMVAINEHMIRTSAGGLTYASDLKFDHLEHKMDHLACFAGGLYALAASTRQNQHANKFMEIGKGLTNTCHESYTRTPTKLGPEAFRFSDAAEARALKSQEKYYILRPETMESYFVLWRLTHDQKYRDWGWEAVQALETYCRTAHGYSGIKNVYQENPQKDDVQQSFFLAETLKYLYLLFSDDSLLPLDEWIFNTEAHPLPIRGANAFYRAAPPAQTQADENR